CELRVEQMQVQGDSIRKRLWRIRRLQCDASMRRRRLAVFPHAQGVVQSDFVAFDIRLAAIKTIIKSRTWAELAEALGSARHIIERRLIPIERENRGPIV